MNAHYHSEALAEVRERILAQEGIVEEARAHIRAAEKSLAAAEELLAKLRVVESYHANPDGALTESSEAADATDASDTSAGLHNLDADEIRGRAEKVLREAGKKHPMKIMEIIHKTIDSNYAADVDDRKLENRVTSALRKRPDRFAKASPGLWTLTEYADGAAK